MTEAGARTRAERIADFLEVDTRHLAIHRIVYGILLVGYVANVSSADRVVAFFSDEGGMPLSAHRQVARVHAESTIFAFAHTPTEAALVLAALALLGVLVSLGLFTRVVVPLSILGVMSMHHRISHVVNGSMATIHLLVIPWMFLPLGQHFSVDAWLAKRRGEERPPLRVRSLAPTVLRLQLFVVYLLNALVKIGPSWLNGQAVHFTLYHSRMVWPHTAAFRHAEPSWFSPPVTYGALAIEYALPFVLLFPFRRPLMRRVAATLMVMLHGGIACLLDVGPFPFVFGTAALMLFAAEDGARLPAFLGGGIPAVTEPRPARGFLARPRELFLAFYIVLSTFLVWCNNPGIKQVIGPPFPTPRLTRVTEFFYLSQAWFMFSPEPPRKDRVLLPIVMLRDGRAIDAWTFRRPRYGELENTYHAADYFLQIWDGKVVDLRSGEVMEAFARYSADRMVRLGRFRRDQIERVELHELEQRRPERAGATGGVTFSRVVFQKTYWPEERPGEPGP